MISYVLELRQQILKSRQRGALRSLSFRISYEHRPAQPFNFERLPMVQGSVGAKVRRRIHVQTYMHAPKPLYLVPVHARIHTYVPRTTADPGGPAALSNQVRSIHTKIHTYMRPLQTITVQLALNQLLNQLLKPLENIAK